MYKFISMYNTNEQLHIFDCHFSTSYYLYYLHTRTYIRNITYLSDMQMCM